MYYATVEIHPNTAQTTSLFFSHLSIRKTVFSKLSTLKGSVDVFKEKKIRMDETLFSICCLLMVSKFSRGI